MPVRISENFELSTASTVACGLCTLFIFRAILSKSKSSNVPSVGYSGPIIGWITAAKSMLRANIMYREGYESHQPNSFSVRQLGLGNIILVTGEQQRDELRKAPEHVLSFKASTADGLEADYTLGPNIIPNDYHAPLVLTRLTKNLENLFPEVYEELRQACEDEFPAKNLGEWVTFKLGDPLRRVVSRTTNRILVGLPLCRNEEWRDLQVSFTVSTITDATLLKLVPSFLKPFVGKYIAQGPKGIKTATRHLTPVIEERLKLAPEDRPNDFLSWLMSEAPKHPGEMEYDALARRMLVLNFAGIHTTSTTTQGAIYDLAAHPEYADPLREEVEEMTEKYGWTKKAVSHMRKLDSFIRESQRLSGFSIVSLSRLALQDYTFSDGTFVPKGSTVATPSQAVHLDDKIYKNAAQFDGFRFSRLSDSDNARNQIVSTSVDFLSFGHGQHACPGRFFAANEIKGILAHLLVTYDIKMKEEGVRPPNLHIGVNVAPNDNAEICFRKRM